MSIVRENINFERSKDPKKSMDIGLGVFWENESNRLKKESLMNITYDYFPDEYDKAQIWSKVNIDFAKILLNTLIIVNYYDPKEAFLKSCEPHNLNDLEKAKIASVLKSKFRMDVEFTVNEGINFEKGKDPKDAMGLGPKALIIKKYGKEVGEIYLSLKPYLDYYGFELASEELDPPITIMFSDKEYDIDIMIYQRNTIGEGIHGVTVDISLPNNFFFEDDKTRFEDDHIKLLLDDNKWKEIFALIE